MKRIRLSIWALCLVMLSGFSVAKAAERVLPSTNYKVSIEIETRHLTKEQALAYVASGEKVTLDVYLVLRGAEWVNFLSTNNITIGFSRFSYALFDNTTYTLGQYLPDPSDHLIICVNDSWSKPAGVPTSDYCQAEGYDATWFAIPSWQLQNGGGGLTLEWPTYAYSVGNDPSTNPIKLTDARVTQDGNNIKVKLYQLQFILKDATRDYPVGLLDENFPKGLNGSHGAAELNIKQLSGQDLWVWPGFPSVPGTTKTDAKDWTDCRTAGSDLFTFINGGLFIQTGPEVETFEPNYAA